jgi:hypothetical protein
MPARFVVVIIADPGDARPERLKDELKDRAKSPLERAQESIDFVDAADVANLDPNATAVAVVFCSGAIDLVQRTAIAACKERNLQIFPVLEDLKRFDTLAPKEVKPFNGFEFRPGDSMSELAGLVLEGLGLQRGRRKIFISYARADSASITQQLREAFTGRWYTVFHDTVSIRPGRAFQAELLQELADADVMLLLNSPSVGTRPYVQEEITFAIQAGLGGVQVLWPNVAPRNDALFATVDLDRAGRLRRGCRRRVPLLSDTGIDDILRAVAGERTAMQQHRENELQKSISAYAERRNWEAVPHLGRFVALRGPASTIRLDIALGVPTSMELERAWRHSGERDPKRIVYDPIGLTNTMANHLAFLSQRLPLELLDVRDALNWRVIP